LGYAGFAPGEEVQTIEASLTKAADAMGSDGVVKVGLKPGSKYKYSGGGYTILQLIIEEVSGVSFQQYMKHSIFEPLNMNHSTFDSSDELNLADFYDVDGSKASHYRYTALAAASLYTCLADFELFLQANMFGNNVLKEESIKMIGTPNAFALGRGVEGLGATIYGKTGNGNYIIGHEGGNRPAINNTVRLNTETNDAVIIFETGNYQLASTLGSEWLFWNSGIVDLFMLFSFKKMTYILLGIGWVVIGLFFFLFKRKKKNIL